MLLSYNWLKEYTEVPWDADELAERLTMVGMKVESVQGPNEGLAAVIVGEVVQVGTHPQSDRLFVCEVNVGERNVTVVTGATNVHVGMKVPVALPGATVGNIVIEPTKLQGIVSEGMLCSEDELGIGEDTSGIMTLPPDAQNGRTVVAELGLDDSILELEIYPNRPDCQSVIGIAREVSALTNGALRLPEAPQASKDRASGPAVEVRVDAPDLCPRYCAQVVEGVTIAPSPAWLQRYLRAAGMRPINNVVDVTNFVMLEMGQPLHAFDLELLNGPTIVVRRATQGEVMQTLDGTNRRLTEDMLVIADADRPVAIAGIMGGANSEVLPTTTRILLEAATFNGTSVRRTGRRLGLQTEASMRFEKGLDPHLPAMAIARAAELLADLAGGKASPIVTDISEPLAKEKGLSLRPEKVNRVLGTNLSASDMKWLLRALHFSVDVTGDGRLQVSVPTYRTDIALEIDLIEEIARLHGFHNIDATLPKGASLQGKQSERLERYDQIRRRLTSAGLTEAITYSFMSPRALEQLGLEDGDPALLAIPILNPISEELSTLRTLLLPNMLEALSRNARRQAEGVQIFEVGSVFRADALPLKAQPDERPTLSIGILGEAPRTGWGDPVRQVDFYDIKGMVEAALETLGIVGEIVPTQHQVLHPGRAASIVFGDTQVGFLGEVHPEVLDRFDLTQRVYVAEVDLTTLLSTERSIRVEAIPRHPAVHRDLALLAPDDMPAARIESIIWQEGQPLLRGLRLFDVYVGTQVPTGFRSLAYALAWQAPDRTLTEQEISAVQARLLTKLHEECGVKVRT